MAIKIYNDRIEFNNYQIKIAQNLKGIEVLKNSDNTRATLNASSFLGISPMEGTVAGFFSGGGFPAGPKINTIQKFPFATDENSTQTGTLTTTTADSYGWSSQTHGFTHMATSVNINRFSFATGSDSSVFASLSSPTIFDESTHSSTTHGYSSGGTITNIIEKYPFVGGGAATDVGDLDTAVSGSIGLSSLNNGYTAGGYIPSPAGLVTHNQKFPFATDTNAVNVATVSKNRFAAGISSKTHGYICGGFLDPAPPTSPGLNNAIQRFPFATDTSASDVGDLTGTRAYVRGSSSTTHGYVGPGKNTTSPNVATNNVIDKFTFASSSSSTDVGDTTTPLQAYASHQD